MKFTSFLRKNRTLLLFTIIFCYLLFYTAENNPEDAVIASEGRRVVVCGNIIGVRIFMNGVMVLGTDSCEGADEVSGLFKSGDMIVEVNGKKITHKEELEKAVSDSGGNTLVFKTERNGHERICTVCPKASQDGSYRLGLWVRDSTQGLGTLTFYDPSNGRFGALGHGITDVDTARLVGVSGGDICMAQITAVVKGKKGSPGELMGSLNHSAEIGTVDGNSPGGIFGSITDAPKGILTETASKEEIKEGEAYILSGLPDGVVRPYTIEIEGINKLPTDTSKSIVIKITDKRLMEASGGIIQGMSGSPIIQGGKLIGAVTHVFLNDPSRGYGIFIDNMLSEPFL